MVSRQYFSLGSASHDLVMEMIIQDSFHHDPLRDPFLYHNHPDSPPHNLSRLAPFDLKIHKEPSRDYLEPAAEMLQMLDPNPPNPDEYFQIANRL
ncbi:hypothetical protein GCK72_026186 [Caenorhabditis remanei]|uniref:Uncharacterized protein n=1 Tax=Caenorhabditis remanei TaxID=31234 RepID=A0A6A5G3Z1_CAERE|nr:hypothetical protein GCK72_026186 [Caenorhabditis remanei]KAF1749718.1 hypothetical protein GCK72_026186 [Caenorhabditis remanei]